MPYIAESFMCGLHWRGQLLFMDQTGQLHPDRHKNLVPLGPADVGAVFGDACLPECNGPAVSAAMLS